MQKARLLRQTLLEHRKRYNGCIVALCNMTEKLVRNYYSGQGIREWRRLAIDPYHRLEFDTTMHFVRKYLPKKKGLVLDAGGGPGRYTIELCKLGHEVVLLDLSPEMLAIAKRQIRRFAVQHEVRQVLQGSIEDLSMFENETFDCIVCLGGPLSHIVDQARRECNRRVEESCKERFSHPRICHWKIGSSGHGAGSSPSRV